MLGCAAAACNKYKLGTATLLEFRCPSANQCRYPGPACSAEELRGVLESGPLATGSGRLSERIGSAQVRAAVLAACWSRPGFLFGA